MADRTKIEWTDATWNPVRGCSRVSEGCKNCYAEAVAGRFCGAGQPYEGLIHPATKGWNGSVRLVPEALGIPWRWTRGRRIFVNSMSDLFHPAVPFEFIAAVFFVMGHTTRHNYQVLTKRPERMLEFFEWVADYDEGLWEDCRIGDVALADPAIRALGWNPARGGRGGYDNCGPGWPYENVWLGVSVENQAAADERIPLLRKCPAAVRFLSVEPLLESVGLYDWLESGELHWVIVGGESGPGARPMHPDWARLLRDQCAAAGVPYLFKQWGEWAPHQTVPGGDEGGDVRRGHVRYLQGDGREPDGHFRRGDAAVARVGKKAAGRILDGVEHNGYPSRTSVPAQGGAADA